jgi:hypothetical protein
MAGDHTRRTFDPRRDFAGVFEQQGRVRVDADFNELVEAVDRRFRITTMDIVGRAVVPKETPDGFAIAFDPGGNLTIGPGRAYVDGILADNHGIGIPPPGLHFDAATEELRGIGPLPYAPQPYLPNPTPLPAAGIHLAYLDVSHRERTWAEDPSLLDPALYGIDTATRRQVVWQVKLLTDVGDVRCDTPDAQIPGWTSATSPSASRLTTAAVAVPAATDPCEVPAVGGYRGVENRLYRVEIHTDGAFGQARWKWSRDNGSLASPVLAINGADITVARAGRDKTLRFATGDWVEITDDERELEGRSGEMAKVAFVDQSRAIVTLTAPIPGAFGAATRIRRWDQFGPLVGANGLLTLTNQPVVLEDGVQVTFTLDPDIPGGQFRALEHWAFAARVTDASVEVLSAEPPVGPHHHYARLAVVNGGTHTVMDCRDLWPPDTGDAGCECDVCVHPDGPVTLQQAVDQVRDTGGVLCLSVGVFRLEEPVRITGARSVRIHGKGWRTVILTPGNLPAFLVEESVGVRIEDLAVVGSPGRDGTFEDVPTTAAAGFGGLITQLGGRVAIGVSNSVALTVERCVLVTRPRFTLDVPVLAAQGIVAGLTVRENLILGSIAIGSVVAHKVDVGGDRPTVGGADYVGFDDFRANVGDDPEAEDVLRAVMGAVDNADVANNAALGRLQFARASRVLLIRSRIEDNVLGGLVHGVAWSQFTIHGADHLVAENTVVAGLGAGVLHAGLSVAGTTTVRGNGVYTGRWGILAGLDGMRVADNDVVGLPPVFRNRTIVERLGATGLGLRMVPAGIAVIDGFGLAAPLSGTRITGNGVTAIAGFGVLVGSRVSTIVVDHNHVGPVALGGIFTRGRGGAVRIHDNVVDEVGRGMDAVVSVLQQEDSVRESYISGAHRSRSMFAFGATAYGGVMAPSLGTAEFGGLGVVGGVVVAGTREADVRDNRVSNVTTELATGVAGIGLTACDSSRVAGNTLVEIGRAEAPSDGILVVGPFDQADAVDNDVHRFDDPEQAEDGPWCGIRIGTPHRVVPDFLANVVATAVHMNLISGIFRRFAVGDRFVLLEEDDGRLNEPIPVGRDVAGVRGNLVDGSGDRPLVDVSVVGHATVSDNRCVVNGERSRTPAVDVSGSSLVISANYVETRPKAEAIRLTSAQGAGSVLGNLSNGTIAWNNVDIHTIAPWGDLNPTL